MPNRISLTTPSYVVLGLVEALGEASPYDMKRVAKLSLDHFRKVRHAQFYSEPERLVEGGYLTVSQEQFGRKRKLYELTRSGADALAKWRDEPCEQVSELRDETLLKIFFGSDPVVAAMRGIELHENRLRDLEKLHAEFDSLMSEGQRLALHFGMRHERYWIDGLRAIADGELHGRPDARAGSGDFAQPLRPT